MRKQHLQVFTASGATDTPEERRDSLRSVGLPEFILGLQQFLTERYKGLFRFTTSDIYPDYAICIRTEPVTEILHIIFTEIFGKAPVEFSCHAEDGVFTLTLSLATVISMDPALRRHVRVLAEEAGVTLKGRSRKGTMQVSMSAALCTPDTELRAVGTPSFAEVLSRHFL